MPKKQSPPCKMEFGLDEHGSEILLKDDKFQVMMEWEKPYMEACIDALKPKGDVLEVGFGCGYSATRIQHYKPKSHTIIEYHPVVAKRAREWAKKYPNVTIVEETWQNALDKLGYFDTIFFDDYPLEDESQIVTLEKKRDHASLILNEGQKKMEEIEKKLSFLQEIKYADSDIEDFFTLLKKEGAVEPKVYLRFFFDLHEKDNISKQQLEKILKRLKKEKLISEEDLSGYVAERKSLRLSPEFLMRTSGDRLFEFLDKCLKGHMRTGSSFSCYLNDPTSKYEDEKFFNYVITNPFLDYHEKRIPITVPPNCRYYAADQALVITITKL